MRERRLVFGEVAELYDSYPPALVDDLVAMAGLDGGQAVLEVGAGTGKATVLFAQRGIPVLAIEPQRPDGRGRAAQRVGLFGHGIRGAAPRRGSP
jgi:tRNA G46 methylase TrmB